MAFCFTSEFIDDTEWWKKWKSKHQDSDKFVLFQRANSYRKVMRFVNKIAVDVYPLVGVNEYVEDVRI